MITYKYYVLRKHCCYTSRTIRDRNHYTAQTIFRRRILELTPHYVCCVHCVRGLKQFYEANRTQKHFGMPDIYIYITNSTGGLCTFVHYC